MSGGDGILGIGMGTFFSVYESKLGLSEESVGRNVVVLTVEETGVVTLGQEYMILNFKEPVAVQGVGAGAATIMEFRTMEG